LRFSYHTIDSNEVSLRIIHSIFINNQQRKKGLIKENKFWHLM